MLFVVTAHHQLSGHHFRPHRHYRLSLNTWRLSSMSCQQQNLQLALTSKQLDDSTWKKSSYPVNWPLFFPPLPAPKDPSRSISRLSARFATLPHTTVHLLTVRIHPITRTTRPEREHIKFPVARVRLKWLHDYWHLLLPGACMLYVLHALAPYSIQPLFPSQSHTLPPWQSPAPDLSLNLFFLPSPAQLGIFARHSTLISEMDLLVLLFFLPGPLVFYPVS